MRSALAHVGGAVTTRGDATAAAALGDAMQAAEHSPPDVATHGMHAYPARMHAAIATHVIAESPLASHVLFPTYVAVLLWLPLYLRDARVRALLTKPV